MALPLLYAGCISWVIGYDTIYALQDIEDDMLVGVKSSARAMGGQVAVKTGAEGVFVAILPGRKLGVAVKIEDGATRASECAIAAILVQLGVLNADHPATGAYLNAPLVNRRGLTAGRIRAAETLLRPI